MACSSNEVLTDIGCIPDDPVGFAAKLYTVGLSLIGGVSLCFIIYGGFLILTSQGNSGKLRKGKNYIAYAVAGLLLGIFGFVLLESIAIDIFQFPGFNR